MRRLRVVWAFVRAWWHTLWSLHRQAECHGERGLEVVACADCEKVFYVREKE